MDIPFSLISQLAQASATLGFLTWMTKRHAGAIDRLSCALASLSTDVAVIKNQIEDSKKDHDILILTEARMREAEKDLNALHEKQRAAKK